MCLVEAVVLFALIDAVVWVMMGVAYAEKVVHLCCFRPHSGQPTGRTTTSERDHYCCWRGEGQEDVAPTASSAGYWASPIHTATLLSMAVRLL